MANTTLSGRLFDLENFEQLLIYFETQIGGVPNKLKHLVLLLLILIR